MAGQSHTKVTKGARRRAAILEAARSVFLEKGFAAATLDDVIARSGGSRASLYQHFGSKEGLFAAIVAELCAQIVAPLEIDRARDPPAALSALAHAYLAVLLAPENVDLYRLVIGESRRFPRLAARVFESGPQALSRRLARYIRAELDAPDAQRAAKVFLEMVKGDLHTRALFGIGRQAGRREIEATIELAVGAFLDGVARRRPHRLKESSISRKSDA